MELVFDHVTKLYGPVVGVNDVSCAVGPGITCLFGSNGAGKSTMLKLASGQLRPTQGEVRIGSDRAWSTAAKWNFGFSPDIHRFYEEMTGREFITTAGQLYGLSYREARQRAERLLDRVGMTSRADRTLAGYSHGMRQRTKLAQAMIHDPPVLMLDEPFYGIDPLGRHEIGRLLVEEGNAGKTILVSSHLLTEVEQLTDRILMLGRGRIVAAGTLAAIRALLDDQPFTVQIEVRRPRELASLLVQLPETVSVDVREECLTVRTRQPQRFFTRLGALVIDHQIDVRQFQTLDTGADAVFRYLDRD